MTFRERSAEGGRHFGKGAVGGPTIRASEGPDGIRIEANYVPGKGHLDPSARLPLNERWS